MSVFEKTFETDEIESSGDNNSNRVFTFGLERGEEAKLVLIDNEPPSKVYVHNIYNPGGPKFNAPWDMVCIQTLTGKECPYCKYNEENDTEFSKKFWRFPIYIYPVLDLRPYEIKNGDNKGKVIPYTRKALVLKNQSQEAFYKQLETRKEAGCESQAGLCFNVARSSKDKSPRSGDSYSYFNEVDLGEYDNPEPFSKEELESLVLCDANEIMARYEQIMAGRGDSVPFDENGPTVNYDNQAV